MMDFLQEDQKTIDIGGNYYSWDEIKYLFLDDEEMINDAAKFKSEDDEFKLNTESKNKLENALFQCPAEPPELTEFVKNMQEWLQQHPSEHRNVYDEKMNELTTFVQSHVTPDGMPAGGMPSGGMPSVPEEPEDTGPRIEEID